VPGVSEESDQGERDDEAEEDGVEGKVDGRARLARSERRNGHRDHIAVAVGLRKRGR
jgi:hypothetical protein